MTVNGSVYLLVVSDPFSKWIQAMPIPNKKPETVAAAFLRHFIAVFGIPQTIVSDNGPEFTAKAFQGLVHQYGMEHRRTTPYHPQGNGAVERQNQTLVNMLARYVKKGGTDWDSYAPVLCFAYNTSIHPVTRTTPFELLYGRTPRTPIEREIIRQLPSQYVDQPTYAQQLARQTEQAWRKVVEALEDESARMKQQFDQRKHVQKAHVTVGDLVLRRVDAYRKGEYHKFQAPMLSFSMSREEPKSGYI
ncbi:unnamed protein product [Bursaphelenchus xylophilus]|uniref:(pine wood nematode) hypothetical protein n=1 Tax=Bursaphelenchus xylophilus TaxID=6326 RepID=A0A1I7RM91_BURXY|nr:unnamed protein product [Bursaphelenchus xylophilus]CAG9118308.1 unnamed protein product [Bursaphelenchus xylophilus]